MNELLQNQAVQTALVTVIVVALNALVVWLKQKFPTQTALVESNWCYLQPVVDAAITNARTALTTGNGDNTSMNNIIARAFVDFCDSYRKFEATDVVPASVQTAARAEITNAVANVIGG